MAKAQTIQRTIPGLPEHLDFRFLREAGLGHLGRFSGDLWTDHNTHDPGITILEALCYALLDLGYRTQLDIKDLLARDFATEPVDNQFFTAAQILGCNPLTPTDFRKLLLDIPGVRNAWVTTDGQSETPIYIRCENNELSLAPAGEHSKLDIRGLYRIQIQPETLRPANANAQCDGEDPDSAMLREVHRRLMMVRNLCEDFVEINVLREEQIGLCLQVEIESDREAEAVLADMFARLRDFVSPAPKFYTLPELLAKKRGMEAIFEGRPLLQGVDSHGFLDTEELEASAEKPRELRGSDLYRVILETPGLRAVRGLSMFSLFDGLRQTAGEAWRLGLSEGYFPSIAPQHSQITVFRDGVPIEFDESKVVAQFTERLTNPGKTLRQAYDLDQAPPGGHFRPDLGEYLSVQHEFPRVYGIGPGGLSLDASAQRKAQALQLKGYLVFFDQILANYMAQLANVRPFFSLFPATPSSLPKPPRPLDSVPKIEDLILGYAPDPLQGEALGGSDRRYRQGEVIVFPLGTGSNAAFPGYFSEKTPARRDLAMAQLQTAFENNEVAVRTAEDDCGHYFYEMTQIGGPVLRSRATFKTEAEARLEGESLLFMGTLPQHYRPIDRAHETFYSFEIAYVPRDYAAFLQEIGSPGKSAIEKRNRLLDHLLARFAEDFSDYATLLYAVRHSPEDLETLVQDKEQFLANYPEIGQNRGKGFNYADIGNLWDTTNTSGLEKRVGALLGIADWKRRTISPFEAVGSEVLRPFQFFDARGRLLFSTEKCFPAGTDFQKIQHALRAAAQSEANYRATGCESEHIFGFELRAKMGDAPNETCLHAHAETWGNADFRDLKIKYLAGMFAGDGWHLTFPKTPAGWYVCLHDAPGSSRVVLKSAVPVGDPSRLDDADKALAVWVKMRQAAREREHFALFFEPFGKGWSFRLAEAPGGAILAQHPHFYQLEADAGDALDAVFKQMNAADLDARTEQRPGAWVWQLTDGAGRILLQSHVGFATEQQAALAMLDGLALASDADNFEKTVATPGSKEHSFQLVVRYEATDEEPAFVHIIAEHPHHYFDNENLRDSVLAQTAARAEQEALFAGKTRVKKEPLRYRLAGPDGAVWLEGIPIFRDETALAAGWQALLAAGQNADNFHVDESGEHLRLLLRDAKGRRLAISRPEFASEEKAREQAEAWAKFIFLQKPAPKTEELDQAWCFFLTDANGTKVLESQSLFNSKSNTLAAFLRALRDARTPALLQPLDEAAAGIFKICLANERGIAVAISPENYGSQQVRDSKLAELRAWFAGPEQALRLEKCPGTWFFEIRQKWPDKLPKPPEGFAEIFTTLESAADAPDETAIAVALERTIRAGCAPGGIRATKAENACLFGFEVQESGAVLAVHPDWHPENLRNQLADMLRPYLCAARMPAEPCPDLGQTGAEWLWESCEERIETALVLDQAGDEDAVKTLIAELRKADDTTLECTPAGAEWAIFLKKGGTALAHHPYRYDTQASCEKVLAELKKWWLWRPGTSMPEALKCADYQTIGSCISTLDTSAKAGAVRWRINKIEVLARCPDRFPTAQKRDAVLARFRAMLCCGDPEFSRLDLSADIVFRQGTQFRFVLRTGAKVWWLSATTFASPTEARAAFEAMWPDILARAADPDAYEPVCSAGTLCFFRLLAEDGQTVLAVSPDFEPSTGLSISEFRAERLRHAATYPIFRRDSRGRFAFRLFDFEHQFTWLESVFDFGSQELALAQFEQLIDLLRFPVNLAALDNLFGCWFSFEVRAPMLEGQTANSLDLAWQQLDSTLRGFGKDSHFYPFYDPKVCRRGLFLVGPKFRAAQVCQKFHTPEAREAARDELFRRFCCGFVRTELFEKGKIENVCKVEVDAILPILTNSVWQIDEIKTSEAPDAPRDFEAELALLTDWTAQARSTDFLTAVVGTGLFPDGPGSGRIGLLDLQNRLLACGRNLLVSATDFEVEKRRALAEAWAFPLVRRGNRFAVQLALNEEVIIESAGDFPTATEAAFFYCHLLELLKCKSNWQRADTNDCGPFALDISDPADLRAVHPATYPTWSALRAAQSKLEICLDAEGFHLVEHLLLRPRTATDRLLPICLAPGDCARITEEFAPPEADPYSFRATVVVPYWSQRFRNLRFRRFLEDTLRREAPAHVLLDIRWVDARDMAAFESAFRRWLENYAAPGEGCAGSNPLTSLIDSLGELEDVYPSASYIESGPATALQTDNIEIVQLDFSTLAN